MTSIRTIRARYVDAIPSDLEDGFLYVSTAYGTAVHRCCCGCGKEVVTPLGPTDWSVTVAAGAITVFPSIGNWSFPCKSHYWITRGQVRWAEQWSEQRITYGRRRDQIAKQIQYGERDAGSQAAARRGKPGFWARLWRFITG